MLIIVNKNVDVESLMFAQANNEQQRWLIIMFSSPADSEDWN